MNRLIALTLTISMLLASLAGGLASFAHAVDMITWAVSGTDHPQTDCTELDCTPGEISRGCDMLVGHCGTALIRPVSSLEQLANESAVRFPPDRSNNEYGNHADMDLPPPRA
jgi:hypothetical protein